MEASSCSLQPHFCWVCGHPSESLRGSVGIHQLYAPYSCPGPGMELGSTSGPGHGFSRDLYESFGPGTPAAWMEWALGSWQFSEDELRGAWAAKFGCQEADTPDCGGCSLRGSSHAGASNILDFDFDLRCFSGALVVAPSMAMAIPAVFCSDFVWLLLVMLLEDVCPRPSPAFTSAHMDGPHPAASTDGHSPPVRVPVVCRCHKWSLWPSWAI